MIEKSKKGQAGLDFLMTYGWALLLIVLIVGALFALGVFNVGSFTGSKAAGFTEVAPIGWRVATDGTMTVQFANHVGTNINVTNITATLGTQTINDNTSFTISSGENSNTITVGQFTSPGSTGTHYAVKLKITYKDMSTGFVYEDSGTLTGKVV